MTAHVCSPHVSGVVVQQTASRHGVDRFQMDCADYVVLDGKQRMVASAQVNDDLLDDAQAMAGGLAPLYVSRSPSSKRWLSLGNMFSGGIFLGGGLLHLLPEVQSLFVNVALAARLTACAGYRHTKPWNQ